MSFETAYRGEPPWEIGRPQRAYVGLAASGDITGAVLDAGCGTGENALHIAAQGHEVVGVDIVEEAIVRARAKARERGSGATFRVGDARDLGFLGRTFDTLIDSGLLHTFAKDERAALARSFAGALRPGGRLCVLCFSDKQPGRFGPSRLNRAAIAGALDPDFQIDAIVESLYETRVDGPFGAGARAWLVTATRRAG